MEEKLTKFLIDRGLTQKDIAQTLNVSEQYVNALIKGRSKFGKKQAASWEKYFGLSASWLLTGEGEMLKNVSTINHNVVHGDANNSIVGDNNTVGYDVPNKYGDSPGIARKWAPVIPPSLVSKPNLDIYMHITKHSVGSVYDRFYSGTADVDMFYYLNDDALEPYYRRGDYLGLKAYEKGYLRIIPGEVYGIDTYNDGLIVRMLYNNEEGDFLACCTNKPAYQDFVIPKDDVIRLYKKVLRFSY